jgi:glycine dehydrogenase
MKINLKERVSFESRHNSATTDDINTMLKAVDAASLEELISQTIPAQIRLKKEMSLPEPLNEFQFLKHFKEMASKNKQFNSFIGKGYYNCVVPTVILRNILENPGWYTAYTPYQAEIAQGRLEALINFQTMVCDLTGMEIANASLLDEGTAAAEAMTMLAGLRKGNKRKSNKFFVSDKLFPQTIDILKTRSIPVGIDLVIGDVETFDISDPEIYGAMIQYPDRTGAITNPEAFIAKAKENQVFVAVASDLLALTLFKSPGSLGVDVVLGTSQRFGVPMGYGGPHAAFFATKDEYKRQIPGRIIGVSVDKEGNPAYRMALQTREQHIRREKATSNICTAQVLLAVIAGMYAVYHGPLGLRQIAMRAHGLAKFAEKALQSLGLTQYNKLYFDTLSIAADDALKLKIRQLAEKAEINFDYSEAGSVGIAFDETHSEADVKQVVAIFAQAVGKDFSDANLVKMADDIHFDAPAALVRTDAYLQHPVFSMFHSEHEMLRYMKRLENKDLSLVHSMISLGSCTMKLNATTEMIPVTWPEFNLHPFAPKDQVEGYTQMLTELESWLMEVTGFAAVSLQPNSGAQGEYAGLMVIRAYHLNNGDDHRNVALIPTSAHGTNPASAVMAGMNVVLVGCDDSGNIDLEELKAKVLAHKENLSCLMVTYPSTHGVFEESITTICDLIHENGGMVYMDGANMNAQVGLTSPANIGADVCHLNLHKTFCIPHGGGGPGMGPIGVVESLKPFLPSNVFVTTGGEQAITGISSAPFGSASILVISYAYIAMMGSKGLANATRLAILNANYIKAKLKDDYKVLYTGKNDRCAHEMIIDCRDFKAFGVEVEDIAKRLMDYGFHAPTVSFPVAGTMMIEPTESETIAELDRFCDAMISIRNEIREISDGKADKENNVLKNAPHTLRVVTNGDWSYPYTRDKAAFPMMYQHSNKFWPTVSRIDSAYGDRNLVCSCIPLEAYMEEEVV